MKVKRGDEVFIKGDIYTIVDIWEPTEEMSVLDYNGLLSWKFLKQIDKKSC